MRGSTAVLAVLSAWVASCMPTVNRSGIVGHEIVLGPVVSVPPLSVVTTSAQCPAGKVALSAGYLFAAGTDPATRFGLEMHGAIPDGRLGTVLMRNANVFVPATAQASVVCVQAPSGLRVITASENCTADERLAGGGHLFLVDTWVTNNGPGPSPRGVIEWGMKIQYFVPVNGIGLPAEEAPPSGPGSRELCAPEPSVDGWEYVESAPVSLGARAAAELTVACSAGKVLLGAGVRQRGGNDLDLVTSSLTLSAGQAAADVRNRNILGLPGPVTAVLTAVCARRASGA